MNVAQILSSLLSDEQSSLDENPRASLLKFDGAAFMKTPAAACQLTRASIRAGVRGKRLSVSRKRAAVSVELAWTELRFLHFVIDRVFDDSD